MLKSGIKLILLLLLFGLISCSAPRTMTLIDVIPEDSLEILVNWSEYESFDLEEYREESEDSLKGIIHDVPDVLLSAGSEFHDSAGKQQPGFRIQILATLDKQEADQAVENALIWWEGFEKNSTFREIYMQTEVEPPIYQDFRAPYFRVRIGNFAIRGDAERFLEVIKKDYVSAFAAPDQVRIK